MTLQNEKQMNLRQIKPAILLFIGLVILAFILSPLAASQEGVKHMEVGWKFVVPPKVDQWWNGLSVIKRMGVLLASTVVYLIGMRFAKIFLPLTVLYFIVSLVVTFYSRNLFWVFQGTVVLLIGAMAMGFYRVYSTSTGHPQTSSQEKQVEIEEGLTPIETEASKLRYQRKWSEARKSYQRIISQALSPIDQVKMLANIMQMYDHEGNKEEAIKTAYRALELYNHHPLGTTGIGIAMRGYILGYIMRSEGRPFLTWTPPFCTSLPLELNLSLFDQIRTRLATTAFGAAVGTTIGSQIPFPQIRIIWSNGAVTILSLVGALFAFMATNKLLKQTVLSVLVMGVRSIPRALRTAVNIITFVGLMYCVILPSIVTDPYNWWKVLILPGILGMIYCVFIIKKHEREVDGPRLSRYTKD
jgi:hypothetical protein